jgi:hypothetical protein
VTTSDDASRHARVKSDNGLRSVRRIDALRFPPSARTMGYFNLSVDNASKARREEREKKASAQKT